MIPVVQSISASGWDDTLPGDCVRAFAPDPSTCKSVR